MNVYISYSALIHTDQQIYIIIDCRLTKTNTLYRVYVNFNFPCIERTKSVYNIWCTKSLITTLAGHMAVSAKYNPRGSVTKFSKCLPYRKNRYL